MTYFRVFLSRTQLSSMYDNVPETGEYKVRDGTLFEIEFWLYKFSIQFSFVWWTNLK